MPFTLSEIKNVIIQLITLNGKTDIFSIINELQRLGHFAKQDYISSIINLMKEDGTIMHLNPDDLIFISTGGGSTIDLENIVTNVQPAIGLDLDIGSASRIWETVHAEQYHLYDPNDHSDQGGFRYVGGEYEVFYDGQWVNVLSGGTAVSNAPILVSSGKNMLTTNSYMDGEGGNSMNIVPFIMPYDGYLLYMSGATRGYFTWDAEVHVNGSLVTGAVLSFVGENQKYQSYSTVQFTAGDRIQLYCNGTNILDPRIDIVLAKTVGATQILVSGGKDRNTTNSYLSGNGKNPMSIIPFILPFNANLEYLSVSTHGNETWDAEVHVNGSLVTGAKLSISAQDSGRIGFTSTISFSAGDRIQLYCNGNNIERPRIDAIFTKS